MADLPLRYRLKVILVALAMLLPAVITTLKLPPDQWRPSVWKMHHGVINTDAPWGVAATTTQGQSRVSFWWLTSKQELRRSMRDLPDHAGAVWITIGWPASLDIENRNPDR
jgi:hypothetical protein